MRGINLILENIVYMELLRRGYSVTIGKTNSKEIDFVCEKRNQTSKYPGFSSGRRMELEFHTLNSILIKKLF